MPHDIAGLIAWAKREEWRGNLAELLDRHSAQACAAADIEWQDITDVLGEHAATVLWGAAFEDLVASDLPGGRNIADDYLRRRGWKESASTREYIAGLRRSVISLYEVSGLIPGESMQLRDLVRGGEPVRVSEKLGSQGLRQWDRVATRVIPLREGAVISGTLMLFEHEISETLLASLRKIRTKAPREVAAAAREFGVETDAKALASMLTPDLLLAQAAFMFTNAWLDAALRAEQGRDRPVLLNSEGDPLEFTVLHFPLLPGVKPEQVRKARCHPWAPAGKPELLELAGRARIEAEDRPAPGERSDVYHHDGGRVAGARHACAQGPSPVAGGELHPARGARARTARARAGRLGWAAPYRANRPRADAGC
jgi:hypothetical protein